jgi:hypothetical protein
MFRYVYFEFIEKLNISFSTILQLILNNIGNKKAPFILKGALRWPTRAYFDCAQYKLLALFYLSYFHKRKNPDRKDQDFLLLAH